MAHTSMQPEPTFTTYLGDNRVAITTSTTEFATAIKAGYPYVIHERKEKPDISASLKTLGYKGLVKLFGYGIDIRIKGKGEIVQISKDFPEDIKHIITARALFFSSITGENKLTLLFGSPQTYKDHIHFGSTLITSLLERGPEWPMPNGTRGKSNNGDDVFVAANQLHSSPPPQKSISKRTQACFSYRNRTIIIKPYIRFTAFFLQSYALYCLYVRSSIIRKIRHNKCQ